MDPFVESEDEFLAGARAALRSAPAPEALQHLGWFELLPDLDDPDARRAVFAFFQAQGQELAASGALGLLMAHPYVAAGLVALGTTATIERTSPRRGVRTVVLGVPLAGPLLVDCPGKGAWVVEITQADFRPVQLPGRLELHEVVADLPSTSTFIPEHTAAPLRARSVFLGRVALALEIAGASDAALGTAVDYARDHEQFGQPIGRFQAVRHLLASARVDCAAMHAVALQAVELDGFLPPGYDEILKAVAGRNGRRVCQRSLQVLGGIGFAAEHPHHHYYSRVLSLDSLLGSAAALSSKLAAEWRRAEVSVSTLTMSSLLKVT